MWTRSSLARRALLALLLVGAAGAATGGVYGAFLATTSNPASALSAKRIFPGDRTTSAWGFRDAADGSSADVSDPIAFADSLSKTTKAWATTWSATRYLEFDYLPSLPDGLSVSGASFDFRYRPATSGDSVCFYFEVRSIASGSVVATYGSSGTPVACITGAPYTTVSTPIPAVSTTGVANDLRIRVYMRNATAARAIVLDAATVSGSHHGAFTLYPAPHVDRADGTVQANPWSLAAAGDGTQYLSTRWSTAYAADRWLELDVRAFVPSGATVTGASLTHAYRTNFGAATFCYYLETYDGSTLIGSHGSTSSDQGCNSSTTTWSTDTVPLPEVNTVSRANNLVIRLYGKSSAGGGRESQHDVVGVTFTYSLD
jgi:hypothetical protein